MLSLQSVFHLNIPMSKEKEKIYAIGDCRISSQKQQEGASLEDQEIQIRAFAKKREWEILRVFSKVFSGKAKIRDDFDEIVAYIKEMKLQGIQISFYIIKSIDRLTRGGAVVYQRMKDELKKLGVELIDVGGVIQPEQNTLEHLGFAYDWSVHSPTASAQLAKAQEATNTHTEILTRLVGSEISLVKEGYKVRAPNDGFINKRIYVEGKKKKIEVPDPERAHFIRAMFELRVQGLADTEIVARVNALGYKTKVRNRWNKKKTEVIATEGGEPLTIKRFQCIVQRTIYAGVKVEKWTGDKPIWAKYDGLVSVDVFNEANQGKVFIKQNKDGSLQLKHDYLQFGSVKPKRLRNNPDFRFKFVPCPLCQKWMLGSWSRGKRGIRYPAYHCGGFPSGARAHKYIRFPKDEYEKSIREFVDALRFTDAMIVDFETILNDVYRSKEQEVVSQSALMSHNVGDLKLQQASALKALIGAQNPAVERMLNEKIAELEVQINEAEEQRNDMEVTEKDIKAFVNSVKIVMEHPTKILMDTDDMRAQQTLFGLVFEEIPTYNEILNGTPKLSLAFKLSDDYLNSKSQLVTLRGIEPRFKP